MACYRLCESCSKIDFLSLVYRFQPYEYDPQMLEDEGSEIRAGWGGNNPMPFAEDITNDKSDVDVTSMKLRNCMWLREKTAQFRLVGTCLINTVSRDLTTDSRRMSEGLFAQ